MTKLAAHSVAFSKYVCFQLSKVSINVPQCVLKHCIVQATGVYPYNSKTDDEQILTALNSCRMSQSEKGLGLASIH